MSEFDVLNAITSLAHMQILHSAASTTFLVYDLLTTLDDEVEFIWYSANALPKYLYFISRYLGIIGQLVMATNVVPMFCFGYLVLAAFYLLVLILSVELSLMFRVDALYGKSRRVRVLMGVGLVVEWVASLSLSVTSFPVLYRRVTPYPSFLPIRGCVAPTDLTAYQLSWIPILAFETLLFTLNTAKCISYGTLDQTPLIYRLYRDGGAYYAIIFAVILLCTIAASIASPLANVVATWSPAVFSYSGCHLLLSVRKTAAQRQRFELTNIVSADVPDIGMGSTSDSSIDVPQRACSRPSVQDRIESIELMPRRISVHLSTEDSQDSGWAQRYVRDWDLGDKRPTGSLRDRASHESTGVRRLERWQP